LLLDRPLWKATAGTGTGYHQCLGYATSGLAFRAPAHHKFMDVNNGLFYTSNMRAAMKKPSLVCVFLLLSSLSPLASGQEEVETPTEEAVTPEDAVHLPPEVQRPPGYACNEQQAQDNLIRTNFIRRRGLTDEEREARRLLHEAAIRYRTEQYGYFEGFGDPSWNEHTPRQNSAETIFMDEDVRLNERIIPVVACVEEVILAECSDTPYQPRRLSGLRNRNTYHTGEVSNHVYGIALDVDPSRNSCCGCVGRWAEHELCDLETDNVYDRMVMPECWVHVFERYGFYWLGHDPMQDTMHFEFLGDPDQILRREGLDNTPNTPQNE